jgi:hypothetical protein
MSQDLGGEIEKSAVRLRHVEERQRETSERITELLTEMRKLVLYIRSKDSEKRILRQKITVLTIFREVMQAIAGLEHERSHLIESFGKMLLQAEIESREEKQE